MKKVFLLFACISLASVAASAQDKDLKDNQKKEEKKDEKALIEKQIQINDQKLVQFSIKAKVDSLIDLYSPSCYYVMEYSTRIEGRDELQKKFNADYKSGQKITSLIMTPEDLKVYNDIVLEVGIMEIKRIKPGTSVNVTETLNYMILWKKSSDGKFRIRSEIRSPVAYPCK